MTATPKPGSAGEGGPWDYVAEQLQVWRKRAGEPSYSELAQRVRSERLAAGLPAAAARVGRTTVYDAFATGRTRLNFDLIREIGAALGATEQELNDLLGGSSSPPPVPPATSFHQPQTEPDAAVEAELAAPEPTAPEPTAPELTAPDPTGADSTVSEPTVPEPKAAEPTSWEPTRTGPSQPKVTTSILARGSRTVALVLFGCLMLNLIGRVTVDVLELPLYLDMVGTALAAVVLGPWWAAGVGLMTNLVGGAYSGVDSMPFALCNVVGGLIWGYGVHRFGWGRTLPRFFALTLIVSLASTLTAVPILVYFFDGSIGHAQDGVAGHLMALTNRFLVSLSFANLITSLADKFISGYVALVGAAMLGVSVAGLAPKPPDEVTQTAR